MLFRVLPLGRSIRANCPKAMNMNVYYYQRFAADYPDTYRVRGLLNLCHCAALMSPAFWVSFNTPSTALRCCQLSTALKLPKLKSCSAVSIALARAVAKRAAFARIAKCASSHPFLLLNQSAHSS